MRPYSDILSNILFILIALVCFPFTLIATLLIIWVHAPLVPEVNHLANSIRICCKYVASLFIDTLSVLVVPVALLFCKKDDEHLPRWAKWWDEVEYGINGDSYWKENHAKGAERSYFWRWAWLLRNKAVGYANLVGVKIDDRRETRVWGDKDVSDQPVGKAGWLYIEECPEYYTYPCYYMVMQYGSLPLCFRFYAGFKLKDLNRVNWTAPFVLSISPVKRFAKAA